MNFLDTERLIDEVKKRKAIWDNSTEDYKNKKLKNEQWFEICNVFHNDFGNKTEKEKIVIGNTLNKLLSASLLLLFVVYISNWNLS